MSCGEFFSDPVHPKRRGSICLKIILFVIFAIGVAVIVVSAVFIVRLKKFEVFAIVTAVIGASLIVFSIVGLLGSGYNQDEEKPKYKLNCLRLFWVGVLIVIVILSIIGFVCILSPSTIKYYIILNFDDFQDIIKDTAGDFYDDKVDYIVASVVAVGVMALIVAVLLILPWLFSSYILGKHQFLATLGLFGSLVITMLGVVVIAVVAYFYFYVPIARNFSGVLIAIIIFGGVLVLLGILGAFGFGCERKTKIPVRIFAVLLIIIMVGFLILAVVAFVMSAFTDKMVNDGIAKYCGLEEVDEEQNDNGTAISEDSKCYPIVKNLVTYLCSTNDDGILKPCPSELKKDGKCNCANFTEGNIAANMTPSEFKDAAAEYVTLLLKGNYILAGVVGVLVAAYLIMMTVAVFAICCTPAEEDSERDSGRDGNVAF